MTINTTSDTAKSEFQAMKMNPPDVVQKCAGQLKGSTNEAAKSLDDKIHSKAAYLKTKNLN